MTTISTLPTQVDLELYRGDAWALPVTITTGGVALNLTGYTLTAQVRASESASTSTSITVTVTNAATGQVRLSLTAAQTRDLPASGVWDLQWATSGDPTTLLAGRVTVSGDVTR